jgi:hypothetical protein
MAFRPDLFFAPVNPFGAGVVELVHCAAKITDSFTSR